MKKLYFYLTVVFLTCATLFAEEEKKVEASAAVAAAKPTLNYYFLEG